MQPLKWYDFQNNAEISECALFADENFLFWFQF